MQMGRCFPNMLPVLLMALVAGAPFARAQDNMRGAPYKGYTGEPFDTRAYAYDYLVDSNLPKDKPTKR